MSSAPIGVLSAGSDSLVVGRALAEALPREDIILIADHAYAPYAKRPARVVADRAARLARELAATPVKLLLVASLQATVDALGAISASTGVAVIGLDATLPIAAAQTRTSRVLAVYGAECLRSQPFMRTNRFQRGGVRVVACSRDGLRERAEHGQQLRADIEAIRDGATRAETDVVALLCCHASAAADGLRAGSDLIVIDAVSIITARARRYLADNACLAQRRRPGRVELRSTDPTLL